MPTAPFLVLGALLRVEQHSHGVAQIILDSIADRQITLDTVQQLSDLIKIEADRPETQCLLLSSGDGVFLSGPNYDDLDNTDLTQAIAGLTMRIDSCRVPVIAAISGTVSGAGLDIVLAAHARWIGPDARFRFSHMRLGIMPYGGATQRLPRLVGPGAALDILAAGRRIDASEALRIGLCDKLVPDPVVAVLAAQPVGQMVPAPVQSRLRATGLAQPAAFQNVIAKARDKAAGDHVLGRLVDCIEASQILPFDSGLSYETAAAQECQQWSTGRARRHILFAETRAIDADTSLQDDVRLVVLELEETQAVTWAIACLAAGMRVALPNAEAVHVVKELLRQAVTDGNLQPAACDRQLAMIQDELGTETRAVADVVLLSNPAGLTEVVNELHPGAIALVLGDAADLPKGGAAPNASIAAMKQVGRLKSHPIYEVSIAQGVEKAPQICQFLRRLGRLGVVLPSSEGGIGSAVWGACVYAARQMAKMGVDPSVIDRVLAAQGFALLPFGGQRSALAAPTTTMTDGEILTRCMDAMANAGALLVEANIAQTPADIDLVAVRAYGVPLDLGGPMFWADQGGLLQMRNRISNRITEAPEFWQAAPLLDTLIKNGQRFDDLI